jgi:hypothetical protein
MRMLSIHPDNRSVIKDYLRQVAGKAKSQTITTFDAMIRALDLVRRDLARRFPVPEALDFSVRYVHSRGLGVLPDDGADLSSERRRVVP